MEPPERRQRTLDGVKRLLLREAEAQPLLVVFEDLHWIDGESEALLDSLVESLPAARALLLVNYRPEYRHAWGSKTYYRQIRIDPLSPRSAEELLTALLGDDRGLEPVKRLLIGRIDGNPFFIEESVRTLVETNVLEGGLGAYRLTRPIADLEMPPTVQAMLAARIDRLAPEDKRLLQAASVIGKDLTWALLQAIVDEPEERLRRGLAKLRAAEFLYETRLSPDAAYTFKHALTHDVAYRGVLHETRRALHAAIVEAIERLYADRLAEHVDRLAHHALRSEVWDKAVGYLRHAGVKATARSAYGEAVTYFEQAIGALARLSESRFTIEQAVDLRMLARGVLWTLGDFPRMLEHLREAERLVEIMGDQRRGAQVAAALANYYLFVGEPARTVELAERVLASVEASFDARVGARYMLGVSSHGLGEYRRAADAYRTNIEAFPGDRMYERSGSASFPGVFNRAHLGRCLAEVGEFLEALAGADEAVRIADTIGVPIAQSIARAFGGYVYLRKGDLTSATSLLEPGLALCESNPIVFPLVASHLGYAYVQAGRLADGLPLLEKGVEWCARTGRMDSQSLRVAMQSEGYLLAGRPDDALPLAEEARRLSHRHQEPGHEAWVLRLLAEIAAHRNGGNVDAADAHYRQAMELAARLEMRPLVAHCHLGLGKLYRTGKRQGAQEHLSTAATMFREMDMRFWLEEADAR